MANKSKKAKNRKREKRGLSPLVEGIPVEEFIRRNADPVWLMEQGEYELLDKQSLADSGRGGHLSVKAAPAAKNEQSNPSSDDRRYRDELYSGEWEQVMELAAELGDDEDYDIPF